MLHINSHPGPHVFGSINPEAHNSDIDEMVEITCHHISDVLGRSVQICQAYQVTVTDLIRVSVVLDVT